MGRRMRWLLVIASGFALAAGVPLLRNYLAVDRDARAARDAVSLGRIAEAREPLRRWLAARPSSAEAHALLAQVALADDNLAEVARLMNEARALGCPQSELARLHALALSRMGRFAEAEPILTQIWGAQTKADPAVADALTRMLLGTYRLGEARMVIDRWMRDAPADARPYLWLTQFDRRIEVDNPGSWERDYREALLRDPGLDAARLGLAETLGHLHRNAEADEEYRRYLVNHPDDPAALVGAARNTVELGDLDRAAELLDRALALTPASPSALRGGPTWTCIGATCGRPSAGSIKPSVPTRSTTRPCMSAPASSPGSATGPAPAPISTSSIGSSAIRPSCSSSRERVLGEPHNSDLKCRVAAWMFAHGRDQDGLGWAMAALTNQPNHPAACRLLADYYARQPGQAGLANFYRFKAEQETAAVAP